jgi:hypothetical protein
MKSYQGCSDMICAMKYIVVRIWSAPTTLLGLFVVAITLNTGGRAQLHNGVIEAHGGFARFFLEKLTLLPGGAMAMTLGHVVIARSRAALESTRAHERIHVRQCEKWGPLFIPAYLLCSLIAFLRGGDAYRDNPFEREAFDNS